MYDWIEGYIDYSKQGIPKRVFEEYVTPIGTYTSHTSNSVWENGYVTNYSGTKMKLNYEPNKGRMVFGVCPPKYIMGNNLEEAPLLKTLEIFTDLEEMLKLDLRYATIKSIDITHTAKTVHPPEAYYPYLMNEKGATRVLWESSLYYMKSRPNIDKIIYDKIKHLKSRKGKSWGNKQRVTESQMNGNHARFELSLNSNAFLRNQIGLIGNNAKVVLAQLFLDENIEILHNLWKSEYQKIPKKTEMNRDFTGLNGTKQFKDELNRIARAKLGRLKIEELFDEADSLGVFNSRADRWKGKEFIREFDKEGITADHINELNKKINDFEPLW